MRGKLLFADGLLYDFNAKVIRHAQPADRLAQS
jgi:hypothetical protein